MTTEFAILLSMYIIVMSYTNLKKNVAQILLDTTEIIMLPIGVTYRLLKIIYNKKFEKR
jgi:hypothetical protein